MSFLTCVKMVRLLTISTSISPMERNNSALISVSDEVDKILFNYAHTKYSVPVKHLIR